MSAMFSPAVVAYLDQRMTLVGAGLDQLTADYRRLCAEHGRTDALMLINTWVSQQGQNSDNVAFLLDMLSLAIGRLGDLPEGEPR